MFGLSNGLKADLRPRWLVLLPIGPKKLCALPLFLYGQIALALSPAQDPGAPVQTLTLGDTPAGALRIEVHPQSDWQGAAPTTRAEAHLVHLATIGAAGLRATLTGAVPSTELNVTDRFRGQEATARLPEPNGTCGDEGNCIADMPAVYLATSISVDGASVPVLMTGDASISTRTEPRAGDLPRTVWMFAEPVSGLIWSGTLPGPEPRLFIATPATPGTALDSEQRLRTARLIARALETSGGN